MELDLLRYCKTTPPTNTVSNDVGVVMSDMGVVNCEEDYVYDLTSVIVHHGGGFNSGHYTAYCWNNEAGNITLIHIVYKYINAVPLEIYIFKINIY